jgi:predicted MPP superfamily phosphohydrolase
MPEGPSSPGRTHRSFSLASALLWASLLLALLVLYGLVVEPGRLVVRRYAIASAGIRPFRIALISDLHLPSFIPLQAKIAAALEQARPDLVVIAGDAQNHRTDHAAAGEFLQSLAQRWPTVMVPGDADACGAQGQCLYCYYKYTLHQEPPYRILRNAWTEFPALKLAIYGADDPVEGRDSLDAAAALPKGRFNLLLIHSSQGLSDAYMGKFDLVLAGNTHGGQIGFLIPFLPWYDRRVDSKHLHGLFRLPKGNLVVTSGTGTSFLPLRIGVPPEVVLLDIGGK